MEPTETIEVIHHTINVTGGSPATVFLLFWQMLNLLLTLLIIGGVIYLFFLLVKALRKYLQSSDIRKEKAAACKSLGEALKDHRTRCKMTQEFVAEHLGVTRQAVSKWENGTSDPSTANLLALAKLYGIRPDELLKEVQP